MWRVSRLALLGLMTIGLLGLTGCSEDDAVAPVATNQVDPETAEQFATQALEMINGMAAEIPYVAQGDFTQGSFAKAGEQPTWDPAQMAWVYDATANFTEGDPPTTEGETRVSVWIQFRNGEGPLSTVLGATEMEYRASSGMTVAMAEAGSVAHMEFDLSTTMVVTFVAEDSYAVQGTGQADVAASQSAEGRTESMAFRMVWGMDLAVPAAGCPAGTAFVDVAPYRMDAAYNGQGQVDWTLTGPNYRATGTDPVACGQPL